MAAKKEKEKFFTSPEGHIRDRIILHESAETPKEGVFVSLNGVGFLIKPGVEVDIPRPVRQMLDTRIKTEVIQTDEGGKFTEHVRNIPRITYTLIKEGVNIPPPEVAESLNVGEPTPMKEG